MMRAEGCAVDVALGGRDGHGRQLPGGLRMVRFEALEEIEDAGLLAGVRALARAVFKAQAWRRHGDRPECLYRRREAAGATKFILVVEGDGDGGRGGEGVGAESEGGGGAGEDGSGRGEGRGGGGEGAEGAGKRRGGEGGIAAQGGKRQRAEGAAEEGGEDGEHQSWLRGAVARVSGAAGGVVQAVRGWWGGASSKRGRAEGEAAEEEKEKAKRRRGDG